MRHFIFPAAVCLGFAAGAYADPIDAETDRIVLLIKQLGNNAFAKRDAATKELETIGEKALPALRNAAAAKGDLEIRRRAQQLIQKIPICCRNSNTRAKKTVAISLGIS